MMKRFATVVAAALVLGVSAHQPAVTAGQLEARSAAGTVAVKVNYKGKGTVDGSHRIWIWLFSTPDIGPNSMPIAELSVTKNGEVAIFDGVGADKVWIAAAFDEKGVMSGQAPPPPGTPVGVLLGADGAPAGVVTGSKSETVLTFDDSFRMP
jgi:hypothetical protein